jgi:hypothetical protein
VAKFMYLGITVTSKVKMVGYCSTGQSPQWAVVLMEEEAVTRKMQAVGFSNIHYIPEHCKLNHHCDNLTSQSTE